MEEHDSGPGADRAEQPTLAAGTTAAQDEDLDGSEEREREKERKQMIRELIGVARSCGMLPSRRGSGLGHPTLGSKGEYMNSVI